MLYTAALTQNIFFTYYTNQFLLVLLKWKFRVRKVFQAVYILDYSFRTVYF